MVILGNFWQADSLEDEVGRKRDRQQAKQAKTSKPEPSSPSPHGRDSKCFRQVNIARRIKRIIRKRMFEQHTLRQSLHAFDQSLRISSQKQLQQVDSQAYSRECGIAAAARPTSGTGRKKGRRRQRRSSPLDEGWSFGAAGCSWRWKRGRAGGRTTAGRARRRAGRMAGWQAGIAKQATSIA